MTGRVEVTTARLRLEPMGPGPAEELWRATEASLLELRPWMFWAGEAGRGSTRAFTEGAVEEWEAGVGYHFAIRDGDGIAGAMGIEVPVRRLGELGYWVASSRAGRGYATEAGSAVVAFGFDESQRVAEKLGFRREGMLRGGCPLGRRGVRRLPVRAPGFRPELTWYPRAAWTTSERPSTSTSHGSGTTSSG